MIHNGIEHGMMGVLAEAWQIMSIELRMIYEEIGDVLASWNEKGELVSRSVSCDIIGALALLSSSNTQRQHSIGYQGHAVIFAWI